MVEHVRDAAGGEPEEPRRIHRGPDRKGLLAQLSDWIKLLGLIVLVGESILATMILTAEPTDAMRPYYFAAMMALLFVIVGGLVYDRYLMHVRDLRADPAQVADADWSAPMRIDDEKIASVFGRMQEYLELALRIRHPVFRKAIRLNLERRLGDFSNWRNGQFYVGPDDSKEVLVDLYWKADRSVFSTCTQEFWPQWRNDFGERILEAHERNRADVTRVFIFDDEESVTDDAIDVMRRQAERDIEVRVHFETDEGHNWPRAFKRDFTIIDDGVVIGQTEPSEPGKNAAKWHFDDEALATQCKSTRDSLLGGSLALETLLERRERG